jgi:outer membrane receptor for ferric coprogen and ferric-rhodotorulic acid
MRARSFEQTPPPSTRFPPAVRFFANPTFVFHRLFGLVALVFVSVLTAAESAKSRFDIAEGDAAVTLRQLAQQARESVVYPIDLVRGVRTRAVRGAFTTREAAERMIAGTGLFVSQDAPTGALTIGRHARPAPDQSRSPPPPPPPMKPRNALAALGASLFAALAPGQTTTPPPRPASDPDAALLLSPFEVRTDRDTGYVATNTLAGSRLNTRLADTPASISVMTREFLDDIGATSVTQAMEYAVNAGFDISAGETSSRGGDTGNRLFERDYNFQVRGYKEATQTRDYFVTLLDGDTYNIERIDVARGPNSLLFGVGGPSGVVNTSAKRADPARDFGQLSLRAGSWDSLRTSVDLNRALVSHKLGARINLLRQTADGYHDFESDDQLRGALAVTWRPTESTTIRFGGEAGRLKQRRVRPWAASDSFSRWFATGRRMFAFGTAQSPAGNLAPVQTDLVRNDQNYAQALNTVNLGAVNNGLSATAVDIDGQPEQRTAQTGIYNFFLDGPLAGKVVYLGGDPTIGGATGSNRGARYYRTSAGYGNAAGFDTPFPVTNEAIYPRRSNPAGPGQRMQIDYHNFGATIEQRLGRNLFLEATANRTVRESFTRSVLGFSQIQVIYDATSFLPTFRQDLSYAASLGGPTTTGQGRGQLNFGPYTNLLTGALEPNATGGGLVANPNAGKMLLGYNPSYSENITTLDDYRVSASYRLNLGRWGDHNLLAFASRSERDTEQESFAIGNLDPQRAATNVSTNVPLRYRHVDVTSGNLADRGIPDPWNDPMPSTNFIYGVSSVVPGQPMTVERFTPGFYRSNWTGSLRRTDAAAVAAQSSFFKGHLITTIGGRRDLIKVYNRSLVRDAPTQIVTALNPTGAPTLSVGGNTFSIGGVYHLPIKSLRWLSLFANKSTNFQDQNNALRFEDEQVRQRLEIGPLRGIGRDYGFKASFLDGRINATLTRFTVDQDNVASGIGSAQVTSYIDAIWTTIQNNGPSTTQTDRQNPTGHRVGGNDTRSQTAKGWELELTANPTKSWRVSFNISDTENVQTKLGSNLTGYLEKHRATWQSRSSLNYDTGLAPGFLNNAGGSNTIGALLHGLDNVWLPFLKANEGLPQVNSRALRINAFTSYRLSGGWLKGLTVGGGVNYHGPEIIGIRPATETNPSYELFKGHVYYLANAMASYEFTLRDRKTVRFQLNVDNLLDFDDLLVLGSNYNTTTQTIGKWYYHVLPRRYSVSATYRF